MLNKLILSPLVTFAEPRATQLSLVTTITEIIIIK